jgi:hypothetical protein
MEPVAAEGEGEFNLETYIDSGACKRVDGVCDTCAS